MKRSIFLAFSILTAAVPLAGQDHQHDHAGGVGSVNFPVACNAEAQKRMNTGVAMLHSFWFVEARKTFESVVQADPACGVAYWGVAITHFGNPFAGGPDAAGNQAGLAAAEKAAAIGARNARDRAYIDAAVALYRDHPTVNNRSRMKAYATALKQIASQNPKDMESAIFSAFWMVPTASPTDMTFADQKTAAEVLNPLFLKYPQHPGLAHYIIHAFDSPPLAGYAIDAAKRYAAIAPAAPHALHMPSHTFTRLGYWDESIKTNRKSADLEPTPGAKAHASDYMVYAYLQKGLDDAARKVLGEIGLDPEGGDPTGIKGLGGYNALAMPARYALERDDWKTAAALDVVPNQPAFVQAVTRFARAIGAARSNDKVAARGEINELNKLTEMLTNAKDPYWPIVVDAQRMAAEAWVAHLEGDHDAALRLARQAAEKEETVEKHPVTPGPLIPARELLGDILMVHGKPAEALAAYEETLKKEPNRLRTTARAAKAAKAAGKLPEAEKYYRDLVKLIAPDSKRPELAEAKTFLAAR
jgi:tetratricopeptide (TPR) repeat protein